MRSDPGLDAKLAQFDEYAERACDRLVEWLTTPHLREQVIAVARARHITGHHVYGNANFMEFDRGRLRKETLEELGDGVVYTTQELALMDEEG